MKEEIESYMQNYDKRIVDKTANEKAMEEAEKNDGWVTVSGRKKRGQFALSRKESTVNKVHAKEEQKDKKKELRNFYTFQIRESKKQSKPWFRLFSVFMKDFNIRCALLNILFNRFGGVEKEI